MNQKLKKRQYSRTLSGWSWRSWKFNRSTAQRWNTSVPWCQYVSFRIKVPLDRRRESKPSHMATICELVEKYAQPIPFAPLRAPSNQNFFSTNYYTDGLFRCFDLRAIHPHFARFLCSSHPLRRISGDRINFSWRKNHLHLMHGKCPKTIQQKMAWNQESTHQDGMTPNFSD